MEGGIGLQQQKIPSRRTKRACDGCRIRKVKCSGMVPCTQCQSNNIPCIAQLRSFEKGEQKPLQRQTQYLLFERARLTRGVQILYKQTLSDVPWQGEPITEIPSEGPSIHEILQRLEGHTSMPYLSTAVSIAQNGQDVNVSDITNGRKASDASEALSIADSTGTSSDIYTDRYNFCETMLGDTNLNTDAAYGVGHLPDSPSSYSVAFPPSTYQYGSFYEDNFGIPNLSYNMNVANNDMFIVPQNLSPSHLTLSEWRNPKRFDEGVPGLIGFRHFLGSSAQEVSYGN